MLNLNGLMDLYTDFLISQNGQATATGLSEILDGKVSHDKITRLLNQNSLSSKQLWQAVKPIVKKQKTEAVLAIDDTIIEKPYSHENDIVCWHYSHAKSRVVKGMEVLSCAAIYDNATLPICYEITNKTDCYENEKQKIKRRSTDTKNQRFRRLLDQAYSCNINFSYVLADNWFGAKANLEHIHDKLKKKFIIGIKSNRLASLTKSPSELTRVESLDIESGTTITVYLRGIDFPVKLLKQVFKNEDGSSGTLYLVTNDHDILASKILEIYKKRWKIEEFHKSFKNNASATKSPTKTPISQANHIFASILAFCKLEVIKQATALNHFAMKAKLKLEADRAAFWTLCKLKLLTT